MFKSGMLSVFILSSAMLFSGYAAGEGYAKQVCTATNQHTGQRFIGKSGKYVVGSQIGDIAREEGCSKAKRFCMNASDPGVPCECVPTNEKDGGDCRKIEL